MKNVCAIYRICHTHEWVILHIWRIFVRVCVLWRMCYVECWHITWLTYWCWLAPTSAISTKPRLQCVRHSCNVSVTFAMRYCIMLSLAPSHVCNVRHSRNVSVTFAICQSLLHRYAISQHQALMSYIKCQWMSLVTNELCDTYDSGKSLHHYSIISTNMSFT